MNELLLQYIRKIARPYFLPEGAEASQKDIAIKSKLALGLTLLGVVELFNLPTTKEDLAALCCLLCLEKKSEKAIQDEINQMKAAFKGRYVCCWSSN